jgi:hypothetical protein
VSKIAKRCGRARKRLARKYLINKLHDAILETQIPADWKRRPFLTIKIAAAITGRSRGDIYRLMGTGDLLAANLLGKSLIVTKSVIALLAKATPWKSDLGRVAAAVARRVAASSKRHARRAMTGEVSHPHETAAPCERDAAD